MYRRPSFLFDQLPLEDPLAELMATEFYELRGVWPGQFHEIVDNLTLIPGRIICPSRRCTASKELAIFIMLCHWRKADKWKDVSHAVRQE
jgi:hypothetical protein